MKQKYGYYLGVTIVLWKNKEMMGLFIYGSTLVFIYGFEMIGSVGLGSWEFRSIDQLKSFQMIWISLKIFLKSIGRTKG